MAYVLYYVCRLLMLPMCSSWPYSRPSLFLLTHHDIRRVLVGKHLIHSSNPHGNSGRLGVTLPQVIISQIFTTPTSALRNRSSLDIIPNVGSSSCGEPISQSGKASRRSPLPFITADEPSLSQLTCLSYIAPRDSEKECRDQNSTKY